MRVYHHRKRDHFSRRDGFQSILAVPGRATSWEREGNGFRCTVGSVPIPGSGGYSLIVESGGIATLLNRFAPEVVEIGTPYLLPRLVRKAFGSVTSATVGFYHANFPEVYVKPLAESMLPQRVANRAVDLAWRHAGRVYGGMTAVFAASRSMLRKLRALGLRRLFHAPLGVDPGLFHPGMRSEALRADLGATGGRRLVLFMARHHPEKGIDLLLKAYPRFRDPGSVVLAVGGHGPWGGALEDFISEYPEVRRIPFLSDRREVARLLASTDVYLALGHNETFGLAAMEALASGTVTVFPACGAGGDMAEDLGLMPGFEPFSWTSLADAVELALGKAGPESSRAVRRYAEDGKDWETAFRRFERYYRMVAEAHRAEEPDRLVPPGDWWSG